MSNGKNWSYRDFKCALFFLKIDIYYKALTLVSVRSHSVDFAFFRNLGLFMTIPLEEGQSGRVGMKYAPIALESTTTFV